MDKNYNSTRDKLILPEYGRNVVSMVNELLLIEDRDKRNKQAQTVINVMGSINPTLRDSTDYRHKLWDHLFILSDFRLDIDSPYEIPSREVLETKPCKVNYRREYIRQKQYGHNIREAIKLLCENVDKEDPHTINSISIDIAKFMRQKSFEYNNEYPSNEVILADFNRFAGGVLKLDESALQGSSVSSHKSSRTRTNSHNNNNNNNRNGQHQRKSGGRQQTQRRNGN